MPGTKSRTETAFDRDRRLININDLFTVNLLTSYIRWKLGTGGEADREFQSRFVAYGT
jgi:hypothetical protein